MVLVVVVDCLIGFRCFFFPLFSRPISVAGRDVGAQGGDVLNLPCDRYPRRASDGGSSFGQYRPVSEMEAECSGSPSSSSFQAILQESQALQVYFSLPCNTLLVSS